MRIGYFKHWFQPQYSFITFLREEMKIDVVEINFRKRGYLDDIDVAIIEQNGFNDFIENDELYFREFVHRGGICLFMHQDYRRWAKYFLPEGILSAIYRRTKTHRKQRRYTIREQYFRLFRTPYDGVYLYPLSGLYEYFTGACLAGGDRGGHIG